MSDESVEESIAAANAELDNWEAGAARWAPDGSHENFSPLVEHDPVADIIGHGAKPESVNWSTIRKVLLEQQPDLRRVPPAILHNIVDRYANMLTAENIAVVLDVVEESPEPQPWIRILAQPDLERQGLMMSIAITDQGWVEQLIADETLARAHPDHLEDLIWRALYGLVEHLAYETRGLNARLSAVLRYGIHRTLNETVPGYRHWWQRGGKKPRRFGWDDPDSQPVMDMRWYDAMRTFAGTGGDWTYQVEVDMRAPETLLMLATGDVRWQGQSLRVVIQDEVQRMATMSLTEVRANAESIQRRRDEARDPYQFQLQMYSVGVNANGEPVVNPESGIDLSRYLREALFQPSAESAEHARRASEVLDTLVAAANHAAESVDEFHEAMEEPVSRRHGVRAQETPYGPPQRGRRRH